MLYLFCGSDVEKTRAKAFEWVAKARAKEPNLAYLRLTKEELTPGVLQDATFSGGLFVKRLLVLIDDPFQKTRMSEDEEEAENASILDHSIDALCDSENAIVILAPKLVSVKAKKIGAKARMVYTFDAKTGATATRGFNSSLVNALAARSKEKLWLEIHRALMAGDAPEVLHGLLHWKARDLMEKKRDAASRELSLELIELLQASRRGGLELSLALERFALSL